MEINFTEIEKKVRQIWDKVKIYKTKLNVSKDVKKYILDMFPYPSGSWLHVWHWRWYVLSDVMAKIQKMEWKEVLHPMWFDSFWLPAENYAIKTWKHPKKTTFEAIKTFRKQLDETWNWYDWDLEVITCKPEYYKWNQWIFLQFYKKWLVYKAEAPVNWCPNCKTVLANEQVEDGKCERCKTPVVKKFLSQWFFKITDYASQLYDDLEKLDWWPERVKVMQKNWIWKSEGSQFKMQLYKDENKIVDFEVFTTRLDTVFGMTYVVFSPEKIYKFIREWILTPENLENFEQVSKYIEISLAKPEKDRTSDKNKTWIKLEGFYSINPFNWEKVQVWISDYVIWSYWTGVVMAVPAHDSRDWQFAKKFNIPIKRVIIPPEKIVFKVSKELIKDIDEALKQADENELFYKFSQDYVLWWIDIRQREFYQYWIKRFVNWWFKSVEEDIHKFDIEKWEYLSVNNTLSVSLFDFQENTAYTLKWLVKIS